MGKKLTIYLINGNEFGPRTIEIGNWSGKAIFSPSPTIHKVVQRDELGRPGGHELSPDSFHAYDDAILQIVADEEGLTSLPIITQMDFGHTDPMFVLPYGIQAEIDSDWRKFTILENAVEPD